MVFCEDGTEAPLSFVVMRGVNVGWEIVSERLRAAGSMSGMLAAGIASMEAKA